MWDKVMSILGGNLLGGVKDLVQTFKLPPEQQLAFDAKMAELQTQAELKLAELEFLRSETGEYPVLLLDDVMSELDVTRRHQLLSFIRKEHIQTMITATDESYFPKERIGTYHYVKAGSIVW